MNQPDIIPHLFKTEYRKIISVIARYVGISQIEIAEDIVSDTFYSAAHDWGMNGIPENPVAWLYTVAKNKAKNYFKRRAVFDRKIAAELKNAAERYTETDIDFSEENIKDSALQMMFAICHPSISAEAQIGLALRILCGFGIDEIADAFITNKETINKRLARAKQKLRDEQVNITFPAIGEIEKRLENVLKTIYLMFTQGYYSVSHAQTVRKDLCYEAMRLCFMLTENVSTNKPMVNALYSLMCFHASRFDARIGEDGLLILYAEQDIDRWDKDLINKGIYYFRCSATGERLSRYHLEAGIAYWYTVPGESREKWENILQLYNLLLQLEYSPVAALNRTYAFSKIYGRQKAIADAERLQLRYHLFYYVLLGELYETIDNQKSLEHFRNALLLARKDVDRRVIEAKIVKLGGTSDREMQA